MRRRNARRKRRYGNLAGTVATFAAIMVIAVVAGWFWPSETLSGRAVAVDGDTLRFGSARVRLSGLDAVELDQTCIAGGREWPCGRDAHSFLAGALSRGDADCRGEERDQYGRVLGHCTVAGEDLGGALVAAGWAVADLEYALQLADARLNRRGIWAGSFEDPAIWRRRNDGESFDLWSWILGRLTN